MHVHILGHHLSIRASIIYKPTCLSVNIPSITTNPSGNQSLLPFLLWLWQRSLSVFLLSSSTFLPPLFLWEQGSTTNVTTSNRLFAIQQQQHKCTTNTQAWRLTQAQTRSHIRWRWLTQTDAETNTVSMAEPERERERAIEWALRERAHGLSLELAALCLAQLLCSCCRRLLFTWLLALGFCCLCLCCCHCCCVEPCAVLAARTHTFTHAQA